MDCSRCMTATYAQPRAQFTSPTSAYPLYVAHGAMIFGSKGIQSVAQVEEVCWTLRLAAQRTATLERMCIEVGEPSARQSVSRPVVTNM